MIDYAHGVHVGDKYINNQGLEIVVLDVDKWTIKWTAVGYEAILPGTWWTVDSFQATFSKVEFPGLDALLEAQTMKPKPGQIWCKDQFQPNSFVRVIHIRNDELVYYILQNGHTTFESMEPFMEHYKLVVDVKE